MLKKRESKALRNRLKMSSDFALKALWQSEIYRFFIRNGRTFNSILTRCVNEGTIVPLSRFGSLTIGLLVSLAMQGSPNAFEQELDDFDVPSRFGEIFAPGIESMATYKIAPAFFVGMVGKVF
jgi:hypothetical protein